MKNIFRTAFCLTIILSAFTTTSCSNDQQEVKYQNLTHTDQEAFAEAQHQDFKTKHETAVANEVIPPIDTPSTALTVFCSGDWQVSGDHVYKFQIVKVTEQFKSVVIAATLAIATYYLITWIMSFFGFVPVHAIQNNSLMSIGISIFVIIIAALNLFLDFDMIEKSAQQRLPKYMEWFGAMGLMVTLVWLYVEFLRLFAKLSSRD